MSARACLIIFLFSVIAYAKLHVLDLPVKNLERYRRSGSLSGVEAASNTKTIAVNTCAPQPKSTEPWCSQCEAGWGVSGISGMARMVSMLNCEHMNQTDGSVIANVDVAEIGKMHICPKDHIVTGLWSEMDIGIFGKVQEMRCTKMSSNYTFTHCSNKDAGSMPGMPSYWTIKCDKGDHLVGLQRGENLEITKQRCCTYIDLPQVQHHVEETGGRNIKMSLCLEVDPFYTDCGASCGVDSVNSGYTIKSLITNGTQVDEVVCVQDAIGVSLVQVNKFVLQLYPFLSCPRNHVVTALWTDDATTRRLVTVRCHLLVPGRHLTHCKMVDLEVGVLSCDTAAGFHMAGIMVDTQTAVTQVMCCLVERKMNK